MLSKNSEGTGVESVLPTEKLFSMLEKEYCLDQVELWDFIKNCPTFSSEDKKTLLLLSFLTKNKTENDEESEKKVTEIWEEIEKKVNLPERTKSKNLGQLVKEFPGIWKISYRNVIRRNANDTDEAGYIIREQINRLRARSVSRNKLNVYQLDQSFTYVKVKSKLSRNPKEALSFIMDTGATVSVIKADAVDPRLVIALKQKVQLVGIVRDELVESLGTCKIVLTHEDKKFLVEFHIISQAKKVPFDGVLGRNFFEDHLVSINYSTQTILFKVEDWTIPFFNQMVAFSEKCVIEGQSKKSVEALVKNSNIGRGYLLQCEISKGLVLCRDIVKVSATDTITVVIRNIGTIERVIEPFCLDLLPVPKQVEKDWAAVDAELFSPAFQEMEEKYKDFLECLISEEEFPEMRVQEFNPALHTPNALICSMDLDTISWYSKIIHSVYGNNPVKPPGLYKITKYVSERMTTYLCTDRYMFVEQPSSKDTFFTLYNLRKKLINEKYTGEFYILELNKSRVETPRPKLFKMIHFLFQDTLIEPIVASRKIHTPKTQNEKLRIIQQNHVDRKNRHYGYVRTYNRVQDGYVWTTMKEDIMEYMLKCSICKNNLKKFKALHKILPIPNA